jgi:hypothetical protein
MEAMPPPSISIVLCTELHTWLGDLISFRGPCQFQLLWSDLKIESQHYIFGFAAGDAQMQKAAKHMHA